MGDYQQWQLPKCYKLPASKILHNKNVDLLKLWTTGKKPQLKKNVIVMMDSNIDTFNSKPNKTWNVENEKKNYLTLWINLTLLPIIKN